MGKRLGYILTILIVTGLAIGWYFFAKESKNFGTSALKAVSKDVPFFVRIKNAGDFVAKTSNNRGWQAIKELDELFFVRDGVTFLDSLIRHNEATGKLLDHRELVIVPYSSSWLFLMEIGSIAERNSVQSMFRNFFAAKNVTPQQEKFQHAILQRFDWKEDTIGKSCFCSCYNGILLMADCREAIQKAIGQMDQNSVLNDPNFLKIQKNDPENVAITLYINHLALPEFLLAKLTDSFPGGIMKKNYAAWSELDILQKDCKWLLNGITIKDSIKESYLDLYSRQKPLETTLTSDMPATTSFFLLQNISDLPDYWGRYDKLTIPQGWQASDSSRGKEHLPGFDLDLRNYLNQNWTGEAAMVCTNANLEDSIDNSFLLLKIRNDKNDQLLEACKRWTSANSRHLEFDKSDLGKCNIWRLPVEGFGRVINDTFFGLVKTDWITVGNGYILMGPSIGSLKRYSQLIQERKILSEDSVYQKNLGVQANKCNFFLWNTPVRSLNFIKPMVTPDLFHSLVKQILILQKTENISWQWGNEVDFIYNTASVSINPASSTDCVAFWSYPLPSKISGEIQFVNFRKDERSEGLIFQDENHMVTAIDKDGIKKWEMGVDGPIMGKVKVIRRNGDDNYFLFNTAEAIYLIDNRGKLVRNFPLKLSFKASCEVAIADYDRKYDYRFLIAGKDRKVYNFDLSGKLTTGWQFMKTNEVVDHPVNYFRNGTKDYLVLFDKKHTYLLDRQGKERVKVKEDFVHSANDISLIKDHSGKVCMVTTDQHGKIRFINFDGSVGKLSVGSFSTEHTFLPVDFSGNGKYEFLFFDSGKLSLYDFAGKELFSLVTGAAIHSLKLIPVGPEPLISLQLNGGEKTILVRRDGTIWKQFQEENRLQKVLGCFGDPNKMANRIVLSSDGTLLNYQMALK